MKILSEEKPATIDEPEKLADEMADKARAGLHEVLESVVGKPTVNQNSTLIAWHAVLCYVDLPWVYFTTRDLKEQTGDDWNDAPYDCNAGQPYPWREGDGPYWCVFKIAIDGDIMTPADTGMYWSVDDINRGTIAWLMTWSKEYPVMAGTTYTDFLEIAKEARWGVYVELEN